MGSVSQLKDAAIEQDDEEDEDAEDATTTQDQNFWEKLVALFK